VPTPTAESTTKPIKPSAPAKVTPLTPAAEPFWKNQNVLLGGGAALLLVGLLALTRFMRKPKGALVTGAALDDTGAGIMADDEELRLRDALQQNPGNTSASLELLRHYYSLGDAAKFEAAAESMHAHLVDPGAPEWDEVLAMGAVLAPNHPLFSDVAVPGGVHEHALHDVHHDAEPVAEHEHFAYPAHEEHVHESVADEARTHIGRFDELGPELAAAAPEAPVHHDEAFDFDLPLQTEETPPEDVVAHPAAAEPMVGHVAETAPVAERLDDIYVGEDAIGTKLDLAKAYLDMGDPEGAKSMLDEVLAEGNDTQQEEARRLLAEIR
jgi:pilus assembly protein FimV